MGAAVRDLVESIHPHPTLTETLGGGWRLVYDDPLGEFILMLYLENHLSAAEVAPAVEGWGGDRCAVYYSDGIGRTVLLMRVVWDASAALMNPSSGKK